MLGAYIWLGFLILSSLFVIIMVIKGIKDEKELKLYKEGWQAKSNKFTEILDAAHGNKEEYYIDDGYKDVKKLCEMSNIYYMGEEGRMLIYYKGHRFSLISISAHQCKFRDSTAYNEYLLGVRHESNERLKKKYGIKG